MKGSLPGRRHLRRRARHPTRGPRRPEPRRLARGRRQAAVVRGGGGQAEQVGTRISSASGCCPGGRFTAENVPLRELLRFAFQVQPFQIEGLPAWANSDRFDVTAKAEGEIAPTPAGPGGPDPVHDADAPRRAFRSRLSRGDARDADLRCSCSRGRTGSSGPKLEKSTTDCQAMFAARRGGGPPPAPPAFGEKLQCGFRVGPAPFRAARRRCPSSRSSCRRT